MTIFQTIEKEECHCHNTQYNEQIIFSLSLSLPLFATFFHLSLPDSNQFVAGLGRETTFGF